MKQIFRMKLNETLHFINFKVKRVSDGWQYTRKDGSSFLTTFDGKKDQ